MALLSERSFLRKYVVLYLDPEDWDKEMTKVVYARWWKVTKATVQFSSPSKREIESFPRMLVQGVYVETGDGVKEEIEVMTKIASFGSDAEWAKEHAPKGWVDMNVQLDESWGAHKE